mgnify:CR=1 FL=1
MQVATKLERWPETIDVPERLRARLKYDARSKQLTYDGFMTKTAFDSLTQSSGDLEYRRAIERLFILSSQQGAAPADTGSFRPVLILAIVVAVAIALLLVAWNLLEPTAKNVSSAQPFMIDSISSASTGM